MGQQHIPRQATQRCQINGGLHADGPYFVIPVLWSPDSCMQRETKRRPEAAPRYRIAVEAGGDWMPPTKPASKSSAEAWPLPVGCEPPSDPGIFLASPPLASAHSILTPAERERW